MLWQFQWYSIVISLKSTGQTACVIMGPTNDTWKDDTTPLEGCLLMDSIQELLIIE